MAKLPTDLIHLILDYSPQLQVIKYFINEVSQFDGNSAQIASEIIVNLNQFLKSLNLNITIIPINANQYLKMSINEPLIPPKGMKLASDIIGKIDYNFDLTIVDNKALIDILAYLINRTTIYIPKYNKLLRDLGLDIRIIDNFIPGVRGTSYYEVAYVNIQKMVERNISQW